MFFIDKNDKILIITHQHVIGVSQKLFNYLKYKTKSEYIGHNLFPNQEEGITTTKTIKEKKYIDKKYKLFFYIDFIDYLYSFLFNIFFLFSSKYKHVFCFNCINAASVIIAKKIFRKKFSVYFYTIDFTKKRFSNNFLNKLYLFLDKFSSENSDHVINLSNRIGHMRLKNNFKIKKDQLTIPVGTDSINFQYTIEDRFQKREVICLATIYKRQGLQLLVKTASVLKKKKFKIKFKIIGDGPYMKNLKKYIKILNVDDYFYFYGLIKDRNKINKILISSSLGIAPYVADKSKSSITYFADVTKPKDYATFHLPIFVTNAVEVSQLINDYNAGKIIKFNHNSLSKDLINIFDDYNLYKKNTLNSKKLCEDYNQNKIFNKFFKIC